LRWSPAYSFFTYCHKISIVRINFLFLSRVSMLYAECDVARQIRLSVRPSVCHTLVLYRNERTHRQTLSTFWYGYMTLAFYSATAVTKFKGELPRECRYIHGGICDFRPKSSFILETVKDRPIVTTDH